MYKLIKEQLQMKYNMTISLPTRGFFDGMISYVQFVQEDKFLGKVINDVKKQIQIKARKLQKMQESGDLDNFLVEYGNFVHSKSYVFYEAWIKITEICEMLKPKYDKNDFSVNKKIIVNYDETLSHMKKSALLRSIIYEGFPDKNNIASKDEYRSYFAKLHEYLVLEIYKQISQTTGRNNDKAIQESERGVHSERVLKSIHLLSLSLAANDIIFLILDERFESPYRFPAHWEQFLVL